MAASSTRSRAALAIAALAAASLVAAAGIDAPAAWAAPPSDPAAAASVVVVAVPEPRDGLSREQAAAIDRAIAAHQGRLTGRATKDEAPPRFRFFPQAGIVGRDLFLNNFTDQDPALEGLRDWDCSEYTYDGHQGHDSLLRSFREQAIGVPVFAVAPGVVVAVHDGEPDRNVEWNPQARANHVVVDHGGGYTTLYLHLKAGSVAVEPGQPVAAGTQLGATGSSGVSNWPHLHFETRRDNRWLEPSAGPCRDGESLWEPQQPLVRDGYVAELYLAPGAVSFPTLESFLLDEPARTGTFVKGRQRVGVRVDMRNLPAPSSYRLRVLDPRRKVALQLAGPLTEDLPLRLAWADFAFDVDLQAVGIWRLVLEADGMGVVEAPFRVVASARQARNRPPARVTATLSPSRPVEGEAHTCTVRTPAVGEDPDYDVVAYRYEWRVNGALVRAVTSAALADMLAGDVARQGDRVSCRVTPTDGRSAGPAALAVVAD